MLELQIILVVLFKISTGKLAVAQCIEHMYSKLTIILADNCQDLCKSEGSNCFVNLSRRMSNSAAATACEILGGYLPSFSNINDFYSFQRFWLVFNRFSIYDKPFKKIMLDIVHTFSDEEFSSNTYVWLGYYNYADHNEEFPGIWRDHNGTGCSQVYSNWDSDEPSNRNNQTPSESCQYLFNNKKLGDAHCGDNMTAVCQCGNIGSINMNQLHLYWPLKMNMAVTEIVAESFDPV